MEGFTATDLRAQCTDTASVDANTGALGDIAHHSRGGGIDRIQAVIALDQHTGAELTRWSAHTGHDGRRQRDLEGGAGIIEALDVIESGCLRITGEEAGGHQHVKELGALEDLAGYPVLHQVFALELFDGGISKEHIPLMAQVLIQLLKLLLAVIFQQVGIIATGGNQLLHMLE